MDYNSKWVGASFYEEYSHLIDDLNSSEKCPRYYKKVYEYMESLTTAEDAYYAWEMEFIPWDMGMEDWDTGKLYPKPEWLKYREKKLPATIDNKEADEIAGFIFGVNLGNYNELSKFAKQQRDDLREDIKKAWSSK